MSKLVVLVNNGNDAVETFNGKEYLINHGENVLPFNIASFFRRKRKAYSIDESKQHDMVCPTCGRIIKEEQPKVEKPMTAASSKTLPSALTPVPGANVPENEQTDDKTPEQVRQEIAKSLETMDLAQLQALADRRQLQYHKRLGEEKLRELILNS